MMFENGFLRDQKSPPGISTSIHRCVNNSIDIKVLVKVIETETFNLGFTSK